MAGLTPTEIAQSRTDLDIQFLTPLQQKRVLAAKMASETNTVKDLPDLTHLTELEFVERFVRNETRVSQRGITTSILHVSFVAYANKYDITPLSLIHFGRVLTAAGVPVIHTNVGNFRMIEIKPKPRVSPDPPARSKTEIAIERARRRKRFKDRLQIK
jgi:hypothetical protein